MDQSHMRITPLLVSYPFQLRSTCLKFLASTASFFNSIHMYLGVSSDNNRYNERPLRTDGTWCRIQDLHARRDH